MLGGMILKLLHISVDYLSFKICFSEELMRHIKNFLLCLVLLAVAGILHHQWLQMSGSTGLVSQASAAVLSNGSGQACNGTGSFHFVNNQTEGQCGSLTAMFLCDESLVSIPGTRTKCLSSNEQFLVATS